MFTFLIIKTVAFKNRIKWFLQFRKISKCHVKSLPKKNNMKYCKNLGKILILVPHADDEWIGTSQVILNNSSVDLYYFEFFGDNYQQKNKEIRNSEIEGICNKFNLKVFTKNEYLNHEESLLALIKEQQYKTIFIPTFIDWHSEHIQVSHIMNKVFDDLNNKSNIKIDDLNIFFYQVSVPLNYYFDLFFYSMKQTQLKFKKSVFNNFYLSQKNLPIDRFNFQDRINSKFLKNTFSAEVYGKLSPDIWKGFLKKIESGEFSFQDILKNNINNTISIREIVNKISLNE